MSTTSLSPTPRDNSGAIHVDLSPPRTRSRTPPVPRRPVQADAETLERLGKRLEQTEKALTWALKTLPRVQEQLNWLEQQLRGTQALVLEHDAEFITAAWARAKSEE